MRLRELRVTKYSMWRRAEERWKVHQGISQTWGTLANDAKKRWYPIGKGLANVSTRMTTILSGSAFEVDKPSVFQSRCTHLSEEDKMQNHSAGADDFRRETLPSSATAVHHALDTSSHCSEHSIRYIRHSDHRASVKSTLLPPYSCETIPTFCPLPAWSLFDTTFRTTM